MAIFTKYQPEALHLKKAFEKLTALSPDLAKIKAQELSSALSNTLHELDTERDILINAFEFCSSEYDEPDYVTPEKELNDLIAYYKTQLKARTTRRNAGKEVSVEAPIA